MTSTDQSDRRRLEKLEDEARRRPGVHRARLTGLVVLGYLYPLAVLGVSFVGLVGMVALAPLVIENISGTVFVVYLVGLGGSLLLVYVVGKAFLAALPEVEYQEVKNEEAPALHAIINDVARETGGVDAHRVYVDMSVNAGVWRRPRWGIFGARNYLLIGLPLLAGLTVEQLRAVLAHEFAHLRGRHTSFGGWMVRLEKTWQSLRLPISQGSKARQVVAGSFVRWYSRKLTFNSLPLRRVYEFEADALAAKLAGGDVMARTLAAVDWVGYRVGRGFWPAVIREAANHPIPPGDILARITRYLGIEPSTESRRRWREHERLARTPVTSDHPCLKDRLAALGSTLLQDGGEQITEAVDGDRTALSLLGDSRERICAIANATWKAQAIARWRIENAGARQAIREAEDLEKKDGGEAVAADDAGEREWKRTQPRARYAPPEEAIGVLREFLSRFPCHGPANCELGEMLLQLDDGEAVGFLEAAARNDSAYTSVCLRMLLAYYRDAGRDDEADPIRRRLEEHERDLTRAQAERTKVRRGDRFVPHGLGAEDLDKVRRALNRFPQVRAAWMARKQVKLFADKPVYVLCVRRNAWVMEEGKRDKYLAAAIGSDIHLPCAVVVYRRTGRSVRKRILAAAGEAVFVGV
jgi:Zn-dependent protease with chaperone function